MLKTRTSLKPLDLCLHGDQMDGNTSAIAPPTASDCVMQLLAAENCVRTAIEGMPRADGGTAKRSMLQKNIGARPRLNRIIGLIRAEITLLQLGEDRD